MTAAAVVLASLLLAASAVAVRERRYSRLCGSMNQSLMRQLQAEAAATSEAERQVREGRAAVAALESQNRRLVSRASLAEVVAEQRKAEADGLRAGRSES